jgi:hypothetical protein
MQTENWSRSVDFIVFMNRGTRKMRKHALVRENRLRAKRDLACGGRNGSSTRVTFRLVLHFAYQ